MRGYGTFHTIDMMVGTSRPVTFKTIIPRIKVKRIDILKTSQVDINAFVTTGNHGPNITFLNLKLHDDEGLQIHEHDIFWKTSIYVRLLIKQLKKFQ